jgi:mediator of RNA polymerase II transcription subunit 22
LEERFHAMDQSSEAYLDASYEDWNKKVDVEVDTLVDGMVHLVNIASVGTKDRHRVAQEAFEAQCRTESMVGAVFDFTHSHSHSPPFPPQVRAATSLLSITHSLKLLLLLSDEQQIATRRDRAAERFARKTEHERALAAQTLDSLLSKGSGGGRPPRDQDDT